MVQNLDFLRRKSSLTSKLRIEKPKELVETIISAYYMGIN